MSIIKKIIEWWIIIYVRLSDEDKNKSKEEQSKSINNQINSLVLYVERLKASGENIAGYIIKQDDGKTGTDTKRDGFQETIDLLKNDKYNCLLVSDLSRGFRNISDQTYYLEEYFPLNDIRFISTTLQYVDNYLSPESAMNLGVKMQGVTNEQYAYDTSIKIRDKFDSKRKLGEFIGAFAPYGYQKHPEDKNKLVIDLVVADVIKNIFDWFVNLKMSLGAIVKKLNTLGIPCPTKYKRDNGQNIGRPHVIDGLWSSATVRGILTNEVYIGHMVQKKEKVINYKVHKKRRLTPDQWIKKENTHEPIIDMDLFKQAQYLLSLNVRSNKTGKVHPLSGLLKCADCNKSLVRNSNKKGSTYYSCRTYKEKGSQFCTKHSIRDDKLFSMVLDAINLQICCIEDIKGIIDTVKEAPKRKKPNTEILEKRLLDLTNAFKLEEQVFEESYYDLKKGIITELQFMKLRDVSEKRMNELKIQIASIEQSINEITSNNINTSSDYFDKFLSYRGIAELTREVAVDLLEAVHVFEDQTIKVTFKYEDQYTLLLEYLESQNIQLKKTIN